MGDLGREHCLLSNHKHQLQKRGENGIEKGKRTRRLITSSVAFSVAVFVVLYLLFCLIYESLYNERVLQIHGCRDPHLIRVASTQSPPPPPFIISFIFCPLLHQNMETSVRSNLQSLSHDIKPIKSCTSRSLSLHKGFFNLKPTSLRL